MPTDKLNWLSSTLLADQGASHLSSHIKPLQKNIKIAGRALTVSVPVGDNLAIHAALSLARPGDVLVVAGEGYLERALIGGIMCHQAKVLGLAGAIIDGAVRDRKEVYEDSFPVFAAGVSPAGPTKHGNGTDLPPKLGAKSCRVRLKECGHEKAIYRRTNHRFH